MAHAGQSTLTPSAQMQKCVLAVPSALTSVLLTRSIHETDGRTPSVNVTKHALELDNSISLVMNQEPMTSVLRGHTGPPETHGAKSPGSSHRRSNGRALARTGGPMPLSQDLL